MSFRDRLQRYVYHVLITVMLLSWPLAAVVPAGSLLMRGFWAALPIAAAIAVFRAHHRLTLAVAIALAVVACAIGMTSEGPARPFSAALAFGFTTVVMLRQVFARQVVTGATVSGALCVYLLVGVTFAMLLQGVVAVDPGAITVPGGRPVTVDDVSYLTFVTLTTVGFGDVTPVSAAARSVVVVEALVGQLYLVAVVARVVSLYAATAPVGAPHDE